MSACCWRAPTLRVRGGVSSWVHQIINGFPDLTFRHLLSGLAQADYGDKKFKLPANVVHREHYLYESTGTPPVTPPARGDREWTHSTASCTNTSARRSAGAAGRRGAGAASPSYRAAWSRSEFLYSEASWNYVTEQYRERCTDPSFVDYFWTGAHHAHPDLDLAAIVEQFPPVRCYHSVSTGYAGFLGRC